MQWKIRQKLWNLSLEPQSTVHSKISGRSGKVPSDGNLLIFPPACPAIKSPPVPRCLANGWRNSVLLGVPEGRQNVAHRGSGGKWSRMTRKPRQ